MKMESFFSLIALPLLIQFMFAAGIVVLLSWYRFAYVPYQFFKKLGIPHPPVMPFVGNTHELLKLGVNKAYKKWVENHGKVFGYYVGATPWFCIADADMLKDAMVKQFDKFPDRSFNQYAIRKIGNDKPPDLFFMEGEQWKQTRNIITPCFTTKKLKLMVPIIERHCVSLVEKMEELSRVEGSTDIWRTFNSFTMEALLATSFGHEVKILKGEGDEFTKAAEGIFATFGTSLVVWIDTVLSQIPFMIFLTRLIGRQHRVFKNFCVLRKISLQLVRNRRLMSDTSMNKDFLQLIMDAKPKEMTDTSESIEPSTVDEEIVSVCIGFILAGYETTSSLLTFTTYLLALNPAVQDKLCQAIEDYYKENEDSTLYDASHNIAYLDWVIQESLRVLPPAARTRRVCTETCTINGVTIPKNSYVYIAIQELHYSSEYWDEPEQFRPERFSPEEKEGRHPMCYIPFGWGPRNCLGMKFAQIEAKMALTKLLRMYRFEKTSDTQVPLKTLVGISQGPIDGVFLKVIKKKD